MILTDKEIDQIDFRPWRSIRDIVRGVEKVVLDAAATKIKAADDLAMQDDYMLDSDDCIKVLRGTWNPT